MENNPYVLLASPGSSSSKMTIKYRNCSKMKNFLMSYKFIALLFIIILLFGAVSRAMDAYKYMIYKNQEQSSFDRRYLDFGIMFDAGSTGSRIHVFAFKKTEDGTLKLVDEVFREIKPGLSSFARKPEKGAKTIEKLLKVGKYVVPPTKWHKTPVALKATAGLRLLPGTSSKKLLKEVYKVLKNSPFKVSGPSSVSILDGLYEGIYAWITVNFLTGKFIPDKHESLLGALDLGGGSTQITFHPVVQDTIANSPKDFTHITEVFGQKFDLYTHSYLGLGLMSARAAITSKGTFIKDSFGRNISSSPCVAPNNIAKWKFGGKTITVSGHPNYSYDACMKHAKTLVKSVDRQDEMNERIFYTFSYFYDRAADLNLIDVVKGGVITVGDFVGKTQEVCSSSQVRPNNLVCMDASYIVALLKYGYGLQNHKKLILHKRIDDIELSWALGATLDLIK